jgi:AcrR family transcriptional regulator
VAEAREAKARRTQAQRSSETRTVLIEAAIRTVHRLGYGAATTALIADEAGISRGAILHQFGTRAELMAEVIRHVFEQEVRDYAELMVQLRIGRRVSDWVELCWRVLGRPSGLAVMEILLASRSDVELAARIAPMQAAVEQSALNDLRAQFGGDDQDTLARMRLIAWSIRGLTMAQMLLPEPEDIERSVALFRSWLRAAEDAGVSLAPGAAVAPRPKPAAPG